MFTKTRSYQFAHVLIFTFPVFLCLSQSFGDLVHKPLLVDLTVEEGQRLKVIYGSCSGFHAVDVDSGAVYDIYLPTHVRPIHLSQLSTIFFIYIYSFFHFSSVHIFKGRAHLKLFFYSFIESFFVEYLSKENMSSIGQPMNIARISPKHEELRNILVKSPLTDEIVIIVMVRYFKDHLQKRMLIIHCPLNMTPICII